VTPTLDERLDRLAQLVDGWIRPYLDPPPGPTAPFYEMMGYHLGWRGADGAPLAQPVPAGKRLRPALSILVCEALGGTAEAARGAAVAVELVHNFSLVHDDVQDESEQRRGRETVWKLWRTAQAINVGDAMFALAQLALIEPMAGHARLSEAVRLLNTTCVRLVEGQFLDLHLESVSDASLDLYYEMIGRKTAALIECACALGAVVADADEATVAACARIGHELGVAFQLQDDLLGVWGDPAVTGKPSGADVRSRKKSLPIVLGLQVADASARRELDAVLSSAGPMDDADVGRTIGMLEELSVGQRAQEIVDLRFDAAGDAIARALGRPAGDELLAVTRWLQTRVF
jgi:geranylgeranyl diphosphate synthase, type I